MTATSWGRQDLTPAMRAQRLALVNAARDRLADEPALSAVSTNSGSALGGSADAAAEVLFVDAAVCATVGAADIRVDAIAAPVPGSRDQAAPFAVQRVARTTRGGSSELRTERGRSTAEVAGSNPAPRSLAADRSVVKEREAFLVRTHGQLKVVEQAKQLGISPALASVYRQRLAKQGRIQIRHRFPGDDHRKWTKEEDAYLLEHTGAKSFAEMAAALNRSETALLVRVKRDLHISRRERKANRMTMNVSDVARILGVDLHTITREGFIPWGQLKASRHPWLRTNGTMQWMVEREDLVNFLVDYPWQYDRTRITDPFFRQVADAAWERDPLYTTEDAAKILGFDSSHGVSSFLFHTAPKFVPPAKLVVRRAGNPATTSRNSFKAMQQFVPRSTIEAIKASGWINWKRLLEDPNWLTAEAAARLLMDDDARPSYISATTLTNRIRGFYDSGAIPTRSMRIGDRKPWRQATPADVLAVKDALFARTSHRLRLTGHLKALIDRHDPSWLQRPRDLALALADGRIETLRAEWKYGEIRAAAEFRHNSAKKWVFTTRHVRDMLRELGPKTKYGGPKRRAIFHLDHHGQGWVRIPLVEAKRRGLHVCGLCEFERQLKTICSSCRSAYRRGRGRPAKMPLCPSCRGERRAA